MAMVAHVVEFDMKFAFLASSLEVDGNMRLVNALNGALDTGGYVTSWILLSFHHTVCLR